MQFAALTTSYAAVGRGFIPARLLFRERECIELMPDLTQ
jgi:hypothetical protein